ncbi:cell adhesion molecule DSCAM-like isoform X6 [Panonychus citri]|uniref:cell adhesion molecule DSCAM-like isoform X6 n=1 Tax=Panonychus citri TaxID=50023 RepID=UPI0023074828|nr:cell adhesion molecule DSCAM-like isoform X6 [Panonychus citri]XP_053210851.1 cell adhesion molecule DSCAM-like isoform X6 [Panonychus citri]XP_053212498.1 cell adhesion molecule DSCAM-like isoform X8 [Panonychus citri]XP_053214058.1 cell adhesion molecule DSCAM-like isoform X6 [Panonychus citri]
MLSILLIQLTLLFSVNAIGQPKVQPFTFPNEIQLNQPLLAIFCNALDGEKPIHFEWLKDGQPINQNHDNVIRNHDMGSLLELRNMKRDHIGNYTCLARNHIGTDSFTSTLLMKVPVDWVHEPQDADLVSGQKVNISCSAFGYPIPKISWRFKNNLDELLITSDYYSSSLTFNPISLSNSGKYECKAENDNGSPLIKLITINVVVPAEFKEKNVAVSAKKGNLLELTCSADGDQPVTIKWFKDSTPIDKVDPSRYSITDAPNKEGTKSIMTVSSADVKDDGLYHCFAENSFGKDERKIRVTIIEPPPAPTNFAVQQVWSRTVSVSWSRPPESKTSILSYLIRYWKVSSTGVNDRLNEVNISSSLTLYFIKDLEPGSSYESTIIAINEVGLGVPSAKISFSTGEEEPTGAPVDLVVVSRGPTTARLAWRSPPKNTWNGKLIGFYVGYRLFDDYKTPHSFRTVYVGESNSSHHEFFLTSLLKGTKYSIIVKSYNSAGTGPESQEVTVETLAGDVPSSPRLFVSTATIDSITLGYSLPSNAANKQIQNLDLHFKEGDDSSWREMDFFVDSKEIGEYTLSALNPDTVYTVYLTASNENGVSDPSPIIKTRTSRSQRDNFANFGSIFDPAGNGQFGDYRDFVSILSIIIAVAIIIIVIVFAFVYVRKAQLEAETKPNFEFALASQTGTLALNKSIPNFGTERRFHDSDNTKPLMHGTMTLDHGNQYPVSYSNLPTESRHSKLVDPSHIYDFPR